MSAAGIRAGRAFVEIGANDAQLQQVILRVRARLHSLAGSLAAVGTGFVGAGTGILGALAWPLQLAANMEQSHAAFTVLLRDAARAADLLEKLNQFAAETPFQTEELQTAARMLLSFGSSADTVVDELRMLGDIASGVGIPLGELAEIYGKNRVQGRLFAEDMNQLTGRGIPIIGALARQFGVSESAIRDLVSNGKVDFAALQRAFRDMTSDGGQFANMMATQSATLIGRWSTLKDSLAAAVRPLGQALLPIVGTIVGQLTTAATVVGAFIEQNQGMAVTLAAAGGALIVLGGAITALGIGAWVLSGAFGAIAAVLGGLVSLAASPWVLATGAVAGLLAVFGQLGTVLGTVRTVLGTVGSWFSQFGTIALQTWQGVVDAVAAGDMQNAFAVITAGIEVTWATLLNSLQQAWANWIGPFRDMWTDAVNFIAQVGGVAFFGVQAVWVQATSTMSQAADSFVTGVVNGMQYLIGFVDRLHNIMAQIIEKVTSFPLGSQNAAAANANIEQLEQEFQLRARNRQQAIEANNQANRAVNRGRARDAEGRIAQIGDSANTYFDSLDDMAKEEKRRRAQGSQAAVSAAQQRLAAAQAELDRVRTEAAEKLAVLNKAREDKLEPAADAAKRQAKNRSDSFGTFNITTAAQQLGFGKSSTEQIAKSTERTAKATEKLVDRADSGKMVFASP